MSQIQKELSQSFAVEFRIIGNNLIPQEITELLEIEPSNSHKRGDSNAGFTKKGKVVRYAPFSSGLWSIKSRLTKSTSFEEHIMGVLELLEPVKDKIKELSCRGYKVDFFCGYFFSSEIQAGVSLDSNILKCISDLGANLEICMYIHN